MGSQIKAGLTPLSWEILSGDYKENLRDQISAHCQEMGGMLGEVPDHRPIAQKVDKLPEKKKKARKKSFKLHLRCQEILPTLKSLPFPDGSVDYLMI